MNLVDKFLETATDEFGNKINFSNVEVEGFNGDIFFNDQQYYCYLKISQNEQYIADNNLDIESEKIVFAFMKYVQQKMKEHKAFVKDEINTQNSLNKWY